jgi:serine/threonine protein kinase
MKVVCRPYAHLLIPKLRPSPLLRCPDSRTFGNNRSVRKYNSGLPEARQATPFDRELWKQWEGQSVDAMYPLGRCTGGSSRGAVFETTIHDQPAAIKIILGTPEAIRALLTVAAQASRLSHPALVKILASGETELGEMYGAYIVMERADDNLADLLAERLLTPGETREMLHPVLAVLRYLAANGFAHGRLKPANIMAAGEQVKISSDSLVAGADECHRLPRAWIGVAGGSRRQSECAAARAVR